MRRGRGACGDGDWWGQESARRFGGFFFPLVGCSGRFKAGRRKSGHVSGVGGDLLDQAAGIKTASATASV